MTSLFWHRGEEPPLESLLGHDESLDRRHTFGGVPRHLGAVPTGCTKPLHLLYNLDLADDNCHLTIPNSRFLPLYYGFQYDATPVWYRVLSDDEIAIVRQDKTEWTSEFPYASYPEAFPELAVDVTSPDPVTSQLEDDEDDYWRERWIDDQESIREDGDEPNHNDLIACVAGLWQGAPKDPCINLSCAGQQMNILAIIEHDAVADVGKDIHFWDHHGEGEEVQIVFQICPRISLLLATNQCT